MRKSEVCGSQCIAAISVFCLVLLAATLATGNPESCLHGQQHACIPLAYEPLQMGKYDARVTRGLVLSAKEHCYAHAQHALGARSIEPTPGTSCQISPVH